MTESNFWGCLFFCTEYRRSWKWLCL